MDGRVPAALQYLMSPAQVATQYYNNILCELSSYAAHQILNVLFGKAAFRKILQVGSAFLRLHQSHSLFACNTHVSRLYLDALILPQYIVTASPLDTTHAALCTSKTPETAVYSNSARCLARPSML